MTGGLSSILQPLSSDILPRKPPDDPLDPDRLISSSHLLQTAPSSAPYASSLHRLPPISQSQSAISRDSENSTYSSHSAPRYNRHSLAAIAREKTTAALANLTLRSKTSAHSLHSSSSSAGSLKQAVASALPPERNPATQSQSTKLPDHIEAPEKQDSPPVLESSNEPQLSPPHSATSAAVSGPRPSLSLPYRNDSIPSPKQSAAPSKMHQTSSRLLRMTDEERPFTRDFEDLFSTLMVSLPLSPHRIRFQKVEHTFTSEEAINNLGSLKFSQSNRMPDPKDPTRIVTTTTTTTFSMAKEMARSVCQRFMDARFIESADGKPVPSFPLKNAVWQLTPKGMHVLTRFCQRNGIIQRHVLEVLDSYRNTMQLVILERDGTSDKLSHDRATIEVIFRRFAGQEGPNIKLSITTSDSDSLSDYYNGLIGVKMARERKVLDRVVQNTFTGKAAVDWLMDCCTTVDRREVYEIAALFVNYALIRAVVEDRVYLAQNPGASGFQPTKNAIYGLTEKGQRVAGWLAREESTSGDDSRGDASKSGKGRKDGRHAPRDSNNNRLNIIVNDAALRLLFREFLRDTHCEENLSFYIEVREFTRSYDNAERAKAFTRLDAIRENLAAAYGRFHFHISSANS